MSEIYIYIDTDTMFILDIERSCAGIIRSIFGIGSYGLSCRFGVRREV